MTLADFFSLAWLTRALPAASPGSPVASRAGTENETKASAAGPAIAAFATGQPIWTPRRYDKLAEEGYVRNVIAYRCIKEVAKGAAAVPWNLFTRGPDGERQLSEHPLLGLLATPNPAEPGAAFWERVYIHQLIAGNSYIEAVRPAPGQAPRELWALRPDRVRVVPGERGLPAAYVYTVNNKEVRWPADPLTGKADILHLKDAHPLNDWYGLSPIEAAAFSIDQHNAAGEHNAALLQSGARISGIMTIDGEPSEEVVTRLQQLLLDRYQSPRNAGRPLVVGAAAKWQEMMLSPRDMDFNEMTQATARNICAAFGVPHVLVLPGEATYRNREDARLELWEQTILPRVGRTIDALNAWLAPLFGDDLRIGIDLDQVSALIPRRAKHREAVCREYRAGLITLNEARAALQYAGLPGGDGLLGADRPSRESTAAVDQGAVAETRALWRLETKDIAVEAVQRVAGALVSPEGLEDFAGLLEPSLRSLATRVGEAVSQEAEAILGFMLTPRFEAVLADYARRLAAGVAIENQFALADSLGQGLAAGEEEAALTARIAQVFGQTAGSKALAMSGREATYLAGMAALEALKLAGYSEKEWLAAQDGPGQGVHAELDGQVIPIEAEFVAADGSRGPHPGALVKPAVEEPVDGEPLDGQDPGSVGEDPLVPDPATELEAAMAEPVDGQLTDCRCALIAPLLPSETVVASEVSDEDALAANEPGDAVTDVEGRNEESAGEAEADRRPARSLEARLSLWHRREALRQGLADELEDAFLLLFAQQEATALEALEAALAEADQAEVGGAQTGEGATVGQTGPAGQEDQAGPESQP